MSDALASRVTTIIAEQLYLPHGSVTEETTFEELGIDSLTGLNLVYEMEKEFGIEVPNEQVLRIRSVKEILACLRPLVGGEAVGDVARGSL